MTEKYSCINCSEAEDLTNEKPNQDIIKKHHDAVMKTLKPTKPENHDEVCKNCGSLIKIRNPTGKCDHLYYPDNVEMKPEKPNDEIVMTVSEFISLKERTRKQAFADIREKLLAKRRKLYDGETDKEEAVICVSTEYFNKVFEDV